MADKRHYEHTYTHAYTNKNDSQVTIQYAPLNWADKQPTYGEITDNAC